MPANSNRPAASTSALVLAKMARHATVEFTRALPDGSEWTAADLVAPYVAEGLVVVDWQAGKGYLDVHLTEEGTQRAAEATPVDLCGPMSTREQRSQGALWRWLIVHGQQNGQYGSTRPWGDRGSIAHVLVCGLDLAASSPVRDDVWSVWGGTFHDDERVAGVAGRATCRCGAVVNQEVNAEVSSVTDLILAVIEP